jgi:hypothetical protein
MPVVAWFDHYRYPHALTVFPPVDEPGPLFVLVDLFDAYARCQERV